MFTADVSRLLVAAASLLLLAACGSAEQEPGLEQALERTQGAGSARLEIRGFDTSDKREIRCDGVVDYAHRRSKARCSIGTLGAVEFISVGEATYTRFTGKILGTSDPAAAKWNRDDDGEALHDVLSPETLLSLLRAAALDTERLGEDDVRGVPTVHYRMTVDVEKAKLDTGADKETTTVDVWVDGDGLVRKVEGETTGPFTLEFFDFGVEADIEEPSANESAAAESSGQTTTVELPPCAGIEARPISIEQAVGALRRHGFSIDESCGHDPVAAILSNTASGDPADVLDREGHVSCFVLVKVPSAGEPRVVVVGVDGADAELRLANLRCTILVDSPDAERKIRPLRDALDELERTIRP